MSRYAKAANDAAELTNKQLGQRISSLNHLTEARVRTLFPQKRDKETFLELMAEVEKETNETKKLAAITDNIAAYGPVILKVLSAFGR